MRRATSGIATCLRVVLAPVSREKSFRAAWHNGRPWGAQPALFSSIQTDCMMTCSSNVLSPAALLGRRLSSKSSSGSSAESTKSPEAMDTSALSSTEPPPTSTLASSDGVSQSLSGPRVSSKRGYLEREGMIRETQQAVRQYYKEGMYQVRCLCWFHWRGARYLHAFTSTDIECQKFTYKRRIKHPACAVIVIPIDFPRGLY